MKILWFSNKQVLNVKGNDSGSWVLSMAHELSNKKQIHIVNITEGGVNETTKTESGLITEYVIPIFKLSNNGLPSNTNIAKLLSIVECESPDIVHVWGVEKYWGLLKSRGYLKNHTCLLDMQGVLEACYEHYMGTICFEDFWYAMSPIKSLYAYCFVKLQKHRMKARIKNENEIIKSFDYISYQSNWVKSWVRYKNPNAVLKKTEISVRKEYVEAQKWRYHNQNSILVITSPQSYKRIDTSIKALSVLRSLGYDMNLIIVGSVISRYKGYSMYLQSLVKKLRLTNYVQFTGGKNAEEIITLSQSAICTVVASSVESYSLVVAENLTMEIPVVAAYSGAMPEFACFSRSPLYFPSGDYMACASRIEDLVANINSYDKADPKLLPDAGDNSAASKQLAIYNDILSKN